MLFFFPAFFTGHIMDDSLGNINKRVGRNVKHWLIFMIYL